MFDVEMIEEGIASSNRSNVCMWIDSNGLEDMYVWCCVPNGLAGYWS